MSKFGEMRLRRKGVRNFTFPIKCGSPALFGVTATTSAASERFFPVAGNLLRSRQSSMGADVFNVLIIATKNRFCLRVFERIEGIIMDFEPAVRVRCTNYLLNPSSIWLYRNLFLFYSIPLIFQSIPILFLF